MFFTELKHTYCLLLSFWAVTSVAAQSTQLFSTSDGLPSSHISHITFDQQDFLWVSTDLGLSRFKGDRFTVYQAEVGNPYQLQENQVNKLFIDHDGRYWIAGCDGLYYFNHTQNSFSRFLSSTRRSDISVSDIAEHPLNLGSLIVTTYGWGVHIFDTHTMSYDSIASSELQQLLAGTPAKIHVDRKGGFWGFQGNGIDYVNLSTRATRHLSAEFPFLSENGCNVNNYAEDTVRGILYMGTSDHGVLKADINTQYITRLEGPASHVTALAIAPDGTLTIGTENEGLWTYEPDRGEMHPTQWPGLMRLRLGTAKVHAIAYDSHQNLWLGLYQRGVMVLPRQENNIFVHQSISTLGNDMPNMAPVTGFASLPDGGRAYALDGGGVVVDYADGTRAAYNMWNTCMTTNAVLSIASLPDGSLLAGTYQGGIYVIGQDRKVRRDARFAAMDRASITDFEHDSLSHIIYIATNGHGLFAYDYVNNELTCPVPDSYGIKWIMNLYICQHRMLWISRADHVSYMNLEDGSISAPKQPKSRVVINGFAETSDGKLWMASTKGLLRYDHRLDSLLRIGDGTDPSAMRSYSALMNSQDGRLWLASAGCITAYDTAQHRFSTYIDPAIADVGTINYHSSKNWDDASFSFGGDYGVITFMPSEVDSFTLPSNRMLWTGLWVDNVPTDYTPSMGEDNVLDQALWCASELRLPANRASFSLSFALQELSGGTGIAYRYMLHGYDNQWHLNHGGGNTANYQSLSPGEYTFEVRAMSENDVDEANVVTRQLKVVILAPWYATWWATLIWLALLGILIWVVSRQVIAHRHARHELRRAETERQLKENKLNLLTSVSHEIRTPLTLIISPLRKLMLRKNDAATMSVFEVMYRNALRIMMLVNQQMDVRKLDRGELQLHVQELPIRSFLDDMMQYFSSMALHRHIAYTLTLPQAKDDMTLWADPSQLDKVVMNLLSNAIKFVPENGRVNVVVSQPSTAYTCITVFNSGSQLPEEEQEKAFAGISLSLAREITRLHGGTLTVRNLHDGVAFDVMLRTGHDHFTDEQLKPVERSAATRVDVRPDEVLPQGEEERLEVVSSSTIDEDDKERELVEQLNDELREKSRMRERRSTLDEGYIVHENLSSADEKLMRRVMDTIHKNLSDTEFSVESLSAELGMSRVHLNRKLKELLDISPSSLIKSIRLKQAAHLLIQSGATVAEVAYSVGFSSPAYFTTNFTQHYGMTPKDFINTYAENPDSPELKQLLDN